MLQHFKIVTSAGVNLDLFENFNMELNMGGLSFIFPNIKTRAYTNSFDLPITKTNHDVFSFAADLRTSSRPEVEVTISNGFYTLSGTLRVITTDTKYSCSFSQKILEENYTTKLNDIGRWLISEGFGTWVTGGSASEELAKQEMLKLINVDTDIIKWFYDDAYNTQIGFYKYSLYISVQNVIDSLNSMGVQKLISYTALETSLFDTFIYLRDFHLEISIIDQGFNDWVGTATLVENSTLLDESIDVSLILKSISDYFFIEVVEDAENIYLKTFDEQIQNNIYLNGFENIKKTLYPSEIALTTYVDYTMHSSNAEHFGGDIITGYGTEIKSRTIIPYVPKVNTGNGLYQPYESSGIGKLIFGDGGDSAIVDSDPYFDGAVHKFAIESLSGVYSTYLNDLYTRIFTVECEKTLTPIEFKQLENIKYINSLQLGGVYRVDTLAYNLITNRAKFTLIKV